VGKCLVWIKVDIDCPGALVAEIYRALWEYSFTRIQSALNNMSLSLFAEQIAA